MFSIELGYLEFEVLVSHLWILVTTTFGIPDLSKYVGTIYMSLNVTNCNNNRRLNSQQLDSDRPGTTNKYTVMRMNFGEISSLECGKADYLQGGRLVVFKS